MGEIVSRLASSRSGSTNATGGPKLPCFAAEVLPRLSRLGLREKGARRIHGFLHSKELSSVNSVQVMTEIGVAMPVPPKAARKPRQ